MTSDSPNINDPKVALRRYLQLGREVMLWKLEGLSEYDVRRPMTATGTNLLGIVKHLASAEFGYFGEVFGRPSSDRCHGLSRAPSRTPTCGRHRIRLARISLACTGEPGNTAMRPSIRFLWMRSEPFPGGPRRLGRSPFSVR